MLAALLLGLPALALRWWPRVGGAALPGGQRDVRIGSQRAIRWALRSWLLEGIVLFSAMARLHPRYTEAFMPAVAALLGIGAAWATGARADRAAAGRG